MTEPIQRTPPAPPFPTREELTLLRDVLDIHINDLRGAISDVELQVYIDASYHFDVHIDTLSEAESLLTALTDARAERDAALLTLREIRAQQKEDFTRAEKAEAEAEALREALREMRDACKAEPAMNNMKYDALGVKVNRLLAAPVTGETT